MAKEKKTVLITGGNRGLGLSLVKTFAAKKEAWNVLTTARNIDSLPTEIDEGIIIERYELDLSNHDSVVRLAEKLVTNRTKIDVIIHNAGFNPKDQKDRDGYFDSTFYTSKFSAAAVGESMFINALHPMELTGRLFPVLADDAVVIAISSWLGSITIKTVPGHYGYTGSKALMNMFIKGMSIEFDKAAAAASKDDDFSKKSASDDAAAADGGDEKRKQRIAVALNPGWMKTDMGGSNADITSDEVADRILSMIDDDSGNGCFIRSCNGKFINTDRTEHPW